MKTAKIIMMAAACVFGLGSAGIKEAYGKPSKTQVSVKSKLNVEYQVKIKGAKGAKVTGVEVRETVLPKSSHGQRLEVPVTMFKPKWSKKVAPGPAVLVMHGSGGLTKMPDGEREDPCSDELEPQFKRWGERLAELGYVVLMPSSYSARGFCDMHTDTERIPEDFDDRPEAVLSRIYDMDAASRYLCERDEVDCDRMGVLGFSHGATMAMIALHWQIDHAIDQYRERAGGEVDIDIPDLRPGRPEFQVGFAYYPGCGTDGVLPLSTGEKSSVYDKYYPTADLFVLHGEADPLVSICSEEYGSGSRQKQSAQVARHLGADDTYHVTVYADAEHGFDNARSGGGDEKSDQKADVRARDAALKVALRQLHDHLN